MSYTSYSYLLIFLGIVFVLYTVFPKKAKWTVLLASSYIFYFLNSGKLLMWLLLTTVSVYFSGLFINKINDGFDMVKKSLTREDKKSFKSVLAWQKKTVVALCIGFNFGILLLLKYTHFFGGSINEMMNMFHMKMKMPMTRFILPLGISYYTLEAVSYIVDVYRGKYRATDNFFKVALFLTFFPQMVEGPIGRYDLLGNQLYEGHSFSYDNLTKGIQLIFWGLFKKIVIADRINIFVGTVFDDYQKYSGSIILLSGILYTIQIYAEFSGVMDIVTGSAQIFSINLSKNFERPFFSKSVGEFWRRWHITLGAWLKEYVFYSVSLSKPFMKLSKYTKTHCNEFLGSMIPASFALFFTWFGIGFWHGAGIKYIVYGMYYYCLMMLGMYLEPIINKFFSVTHIKKESAPYSLFAIIRTLLLVIGGMMMFRADTITVWIEMIGKIFTSFSVSAISSNAIFEMGLDLNDFLIIISGTLIIFIVSIIKEKGINLRDTIATKNVAIRWTVYLCLVLAVVIFGAYGIGYDKVDMIYGQF